MEQQTAKTGNYIDFRGVLIEDYTRAKEAWLSYSDETQKYPEGTERNKRMGEGIKLLEESEEIAHKIHALDCEHIQNSLGKALPALGVKVYNDMLTSSRAWKEAELALLEDLRKKGVSYRERMEKVNTRRLRTIIEVDKGDITIANIELKPVDNWLEPIVGYTKLKELGITEFIRRNFNFMFNIKR